MMLLWTFQREICYFETSWLQWLQSANIKVAKIIYYLAIDMFLCKIQQEIFNCKTFFSVL